MSHQHTPETETHLDEWHEHPVVVPKVEDGAHINIRFLMIFYVSMVIFVLVTIVALVMFFGYMALAIGLLAFGPRAQRDAFLGLLIPRRGARAPAE